MLLLHALVVLGTFLWEVLIQVFVSLRVRALVVLTSILSCSLISSANSAPPDDPDEVIIHVDPTPFAPPVIWEIKGARCVQKNTCPPGPKYHGEENGLAKVWGCQRATPTRCDGTCGWCEGSSEAARICVQSAGADRCTSDITNPVNCGKIGLNACKYSARKWVGHLRTGNNCYCLKPAADDYDGPCPVAQCS